MIIESKIISRGHSLAESPGFNSHSDLLHWVDIDSGEFFSYSPDSGEISRKQMKRGITSVHALTADRYLATGWDSIYEFEGESEFEIWNSEGKGDWRFNDSFLCPSGALVVGTKNLSINSTAGARVGVFRNGVLGWLDVDISLANGMDFDSELRRFYCSDSLGHRVLVWDVGDSDYPDNSQQPREFVSGLAGEPDGLCLDPAGNVWIAMWGEGNLSCFSPRGKQIQNVNLGTPNISSLSFTRAEPYNCLVTAALDSASPEPNENSIFNGGQVGLIRIPVEASGLAE